MPVSRVLVGFGLGGNSGKSDLAGSGGGASIEPIAFLVIKGDDFKVVPVSESSSVLGKALDLVPDIMDLFKKSPKPPEESDIQLA